MIPRFNRSKNLSLRSSAELMPHNTQHINACYDADESIPAFEDSTLMGIKCTVGVINKSWVTCRGNVKAARRSEITHRAPLPRWSFRVEKGALALVRKRANEQQDTCSIISQGFYSAIRL